MTTLKDQMRLLEEFIQFFQAAKIKFASTEKPEKLISQGVSASELLQLTIELLMETRFLISEEHFHSPRKNPEIRVRRDVKDERGNTDEIISIRDSSHKLTVATPEEIEALDLIILDLQSLIRNRHPVRSVRKLQNRIQGLENQVRSLKKQKNRRRMKRGFLIE
jgi:FtsZ-binding cell division protein ZapB